MTTPISSASQGIELAKAIVRNFDSNGDGKLSTDEFGAFLTNLVGGIKTPDSAGSATVSDTPLPPNVLSPILTDSVSPPVQSSDGTVTSPPPSSTPPPDGDGSWIDIGGPFFTNMPMLPDPPGWDTKPDVPSGTPGGSVSAGSEAPIQAPMARI